MASTHVQVSLLAPRARVYAMLLDAAHIPRWRVPDGMRAEVHAFEAYPGGRFRVSLTYEDASEPGKTTAHTDTYGGRFVELVPGERIVEELAFETTNPAMMGVMRITTVLTDREDGGTDLEATHEGLPPGVSPADNEEGWRMAMGRLAALCGGVTDPGGPSPSPSR